MKKSVLITLLFAFFLQGFSSSVYQSQEKKPKRIRKYEAKVEKILQEMQVMNLPQFNLTTCPEEFKDYSAVVLADYDSLSFKKKRTATMACAVPIPIPIWIKDYKSTRFHRTRILLNDDSAVERFSNFEYNTSDRATWEKIFGTLRLSALTDFQIRKSDGTIHHVDLDSIYMPEAKYQYYPHEKRTLRIHGLEKGDIIDISSYNISNSNLREDPTFLPLAEGMPAVCVDSRVHTDKRLVTIFRTINNAPEFIVNDSAEDYYLLSVHQQNLPSASENYATILLQTSLPTKYGSEIEKKPGVYVNPPLEDILDSFFFQEREFLERCRQGKGCKFGKDSLAIFAHIKDIAALPLSQKEKADSICHYLSNIKPWKGIYLIAGYYSFLEYFGCLLAKAHIPFDYGIVSLRKEIPTSQLLSSDYSTFIRLSDGSGVYFADLIITKAMEPLGIVPERYKGRQAMLTDLKTVFVLE